MSFLGDVGSFELFNLGAMGNQVKDNPARLLYGSADPFSTGMWNKVLGTNDKPLVDQWGGAAPQRYGEAQDAGINTGPGQTMHTIAKTIASIYAGGAAGGLLGGGSGAASGAAGSAGTAGTAGASTGGAGFGLGQPAVSGTMGSAAYAGGSSSPGLLSSMGSSLSNFNTAAKPYMDAASYGQKAYGLLSQGQQQQPMGGAQAMQQANTGPQTLAQIAQGQPNPLIAQRQQYAAQRRGRV
ncbi:hypothetical protein BK660_21935 [Pseudomonas brassicacearum]|uniref:Uncharacterized protein n=1 Tax=Pseudomonas brassicacearum TaxID=930166 RepID=A0A423HXN2_9PSED|nr:hypothetical protein [Pseudomonas brassicacearum]RON17952.1 hypothetical protein BK660_21935 [Pseudomonas brassicacearum]